MDTVTQASTTDQSDSWTLADLSTWDSLLETLTKTGHLETPAFRVPHEVGHA